jgi:CheY-like chemotaxis protein
MRPPSKTENRLEPRDKPLIYLVDDEPMLLDLAEMALRGEACVLRKFHDPLRALDSFLKARPRPVLLITDYAMGKVSGLDLIARCKEAEPRLRTLLVSGTVGAEIILGAPVQVDSFLAKPYQPEHLAEVVRSLVRH